MPELTIKNLSKNYGAVEAVKDLTITIADGEFAVFVGPSGCGKTTTLRMIAGLEEISAGEIFMDETLLNDTPAKDRDMAMVFQDYALYPHMSVYDNIGFGLKMRKMPKAQIKLQVEETAEMLGLVGFLKRKPHALSGGERQRVALGRAIVRRPKVFLFDEPLSNLDAALRVQMRSDLRILHKQLGTTFIYVTHDQVEAMTMATKIVVMDKGIMQQADTPSNIYNNPTNMFVAGFVGNPKMNFLECMFALENGGLCCYIGMDRLLVPESVSDDLMKGRAVGKPVIIGIRPEHIEISKAMENGTLPAVISDIENIGSDIYLHLKAASMKDIFIARAKAGNIHFEGECIGISFDWTNAKFFS